ncbi:YrrS family protein [Sporosarcina sp. HYO08]|uniref:YrrS family protein n=1 Tax=Sporosarcina sp. HYO08 TaxID=1759557 RepID=UPI000797740F|nr:YrrS family protein [Sporosarcina sp. HYO08]KXH87366.1 hypothetical protein AU377_01985 [Sporosarcina sp. HYO08]
MKEKEPNFSRVSRKKSRNNRLLNIAIGIVALLIIVVASTIIFGDDQASDRDTVKEGQTEIVNKADEKNTNEKTTDEQSTVKDDPEQASNSAKQEDAQNDTEETQSPTLDGEEEESGEIVEHFASDDEFVSESITNKSWEPVGTSQTGEHVSLYDGSSIDWHEKKQAIAYATGYSEEEMIFWKIKNGGSPQKSIGIVSTRDQAEKYRVYLEWVDGQGWKPVQMDVLTTLDFNY